MTVLDLKDWARFDPGKFIHKYFFIECADVLLTKTDNLKPPKTFLSLRTNLG